MNRKLSKKFVMSQEQKLKDEREKTLRQIDELKKSDPFLDPDHASDNAAVDTDVREQMGHDSIEAQVKDLQKRVEDIDLALRKIAKGTYGTCEKCHESIFLARLELIPEARFCVECERKLRK
jgi:RNA polymerase-binding transcription factor DksA